MSSISSAELNCWENKELDAWFGRVALDFDHSSEATSFFDLGFGHDQDVFDSSDASTSADVNFFDDIDFGSTSTDTSIFSSLLDGPATAYNDSSVQPLQSTNTRPVEIIAPIPQSKRLVHRLRPEGVAISSADLLSIEGRNHILKPTQPKTPPATPQHRGVNPPKTPRAPRERGSRITKAAGGSMRSPKKAMHPSNYYSSPETPSMREWNERLQRAGAQQPMTLPLSPPPSIQIPQAERQGSPLMDSPTPTAAVPAARRMSAITPIPAHQPSRESLQHDASHLAPLAAWNEAANVDISFSPLSPVIQDADWNTNSVAHMQNSQFDAFATAPVSSSMGIGGLMIDFGDADDIFNQPASNSFSENFGLEQNSSMSYFSPTAGESQQTQSRPSSLEADNLFLQLNPTTFPSRSLTPSPKCHTRAPSSSQPTYSSHTFPRAKRQPPSILHNRKPSLSAEPPSSIPMTSSRSTSSHRRANSAGKSQNGVTKTKSRNTPTPGDMFVNFTPSDSRRILTGVAPSGSSKTKARREKEAREERRKMSEAARRAVMQAGGDWESLEGLVGEGGNRREVEC